MILKKALRWVGEKLTKGQLTKELLSSVFGAVVDAEKKFPARGSGSEKKAWVVETIGNLWGKVEPFVIDTAVQLALGALRIGIASL